MSAQAKRRLLAVDDDAASANLIVRVAAKCGYEAQALTNPQALKEMLKEFQPDVLTLDLCMPQEDGIATMSMLEGSGFSGKLIIISGQDTWLRKIAGRLGHALGVNVIDDLSKPLDLKALRDLLAKLQLQQAA